MIYHMIPNSQPKPLSVLKAHHHHLPDAKEGWRQEICYKLAPSLCLCACLRLDQAPTASGNKVRHALSRLGGQRRKERERGEKEMREEKARPERGAWKSRGNMETLGDATLLLQRPVFCSDLGRSKKKKKKKKMKAAGTQSSRS